MQTTEELFTEIQKPEYIDQVREGTIQNISGGGIRFVSGQWIKQNQNILLVIRLTNEYSDETFYLPLSASVPSVPIFRNILTVSYKESGKIPGAEISVIRK